MPVEIQAALISGFLNAVVVGVITVIGWFVLDHHNRKMRIDDVRMKRYDKLFEETNKIIADAVTYKTFANNHVSEFERIMGEVEKEGMEKKSDELKKWVKDNDEMISMTYNLNVSILNYERVLDMGGTDFGRESVFYRALDSIVIDTNRALDRILRIWIIYVDFDKKNEIRMDDMKKKTNQDLSQLDEFTGCMEDLLVHIYNEYVVNPLKLKKRFVPSTPGRRCIMSNGLVDNRNH